MNGTLIRTHLGMGDTIICAGLIREFSEGAEGPIVICAKAHNYEATGYLFRDDPNIVVRYVIDQADADFFATEVWRGETLNLGMFGHPFQAATFDQEFYRQAGLPFDLRWDGFKLVRDEKVEVELNFFSLKKYFVHEDAARGMMITKVDYLDPALTYTPKKEHSTNLFAFIPPILAAEECHCINSSFALLIDSLPDSWWPKPPKLFLHAYARPHGEVPTFRKDWKVIE